MKTDKLKKALDKYKYPLAVLIMGLVLLLLPSKGGADSADSGALSEEQRLSQILESIEGVGEARVLLSSEGAVIVCEGAEDARVKLIIVNSVSVYTGLGWDDIQVQKLIAN